MILSKKNIKVATNKEIEKNVAQAFRYNPDIKTVFVTIEGTVFLAKSDAENHKREVGGVVKEVSNKNA